MQLKHLKFDYLVGYDSLDKLVELIALECRNLEHLVVNCKVLVISDAVEKRIPFIVANQAKLKVTRLSENALKALVTNNENLSLFCLTGVHVTKDFVLFLFCKCPKLCGLELYYYCNENSINETIIVCSSAEDVVTFKCCFMG